ncbi:unnamed protein product, partial [Discosporangium mesarthrocarpum]
MLMDAQQVGHPETLGVGNGAGWDRIRPTRPEAHVSGNGGGGGSTTQVRPSAPPFIPPTQTNNQGLYQEARLNETTSMEQAPASGNGARFGPQVQHKFQATT